MRLTHKLYAQHLGWMFKKHWQVQGKRNIDELGAITDLKKHNINVVEACASLNRKGTNSLPNHIFDHNIKNLEKIGYVLSDSNLIVQGLDQALFLTKTIKVEGLPKKTREAIEKNELSSTNHRNVKEAILESFYYDSQQEKTAVLKNPERPTIVLPRNYGITDFRRNHLIVSKVIAECEKIAGKTISLNRKIVNNDFSSFTFEKDGETIQLNFTAETIILSKRPLEAIKENLEGYIPDLFPMKHTISIPRIPLATNKSTFLNGEDCLYSYPHTIFLHFSSSQLINEHGTSMTTSQFQARNLLKAFGIAASKARKVYGEMIKQLPKPLVVQIIQTDGKTFHFGIFQLNTLELNGTEGNKNFWFNSPNIDLYNLCERRAGKPVIDSYNKDVLTTISAFYSQC